jgi:Cof subfamily protein (haloacid dehalogenase superfamily)
MHSVTQDASDAGTPDKLIAVDLDGTLVAAGNSVADENIAAVQRASDSGATVVVFTGRPYVSADRVVCRLGLPRVPLVAFNGALIRWPCHGEVLHRCPVPAAVASEIVAECQRRGLHLNYYLDDELYVTRDNDWARLYCKRIGMECHESPDMGAFDGREPFKLLVVDHPETIQQLLAEWQQRWDGRLYVTRSMPEYLEMLAPDASKGRALNWMMQFFRVARKDTLAIGDAMNDLPLLEQAGHRAAMPEGDEQLRQMADFVPQDQRTGVAQAIEWFLQR